MILSLLHLSRFSNNTESNYYNKTFFEMENFICLVPEFEIFIAASPPPTLYF